MRITFEVPFRRAGLAGLVAALVLLCLPGTSIASGSGLLGYGSGYGTPHGASAVRAVQQKLSREGWQPGPIDGLYGPLTKAAVTRFQTAARIGVDGVVGSQTRRALTHARTEPLRRGAGFAQPDGSPRVRSLQVKLRRHGFHPGPVDGLFGPRTQAAVERLQRHNGVPVSGVANARTVRALAHPTQQQPQEQPATSTPKPKPKPQGAPRAAAPVASTTGDTGSDVGVPLVILIGLAALALGALLGSLLGRRNKVVAGTAVPVAQGVVAEGTATSRSVGRFRGNVHALVLGRRGLRRTPEARYLVSDPDKPEPFWVSQDEVSSITPPRRGRPFPTAATPSTNGRVKALGYVSVPSDDRRQSAEFEAQLDAIDRYCDEHGWELVEVVRDVEPAAPTRAERQGLLYALEKIGRTEADCIIVSDLGRLSHSAADLGGIIERLQRSNGRLVALDIGLDTAAPDGYVAAKALASVSSLEGERAPARLAAASAAPAAVKEPQDLDVPALKQRIVSMRESGMTLQAIADVLNAEGVPTLRGGTKWRPSSVQSAAGYRRPPKRQEE